LSCIWLISYKSIHWEGFPQTSQSRKTLYLIVKNENQREKALLKNVTEMITYYSKKDCNPCEVVFEQFKKKFKETEYTKIVLQTNEEALETVQKYGVRTVPFIVIDGTLVIPGSGLNKLIRAIV
jgi:glutaredoxin